MTALATLAVLGDASLKGLQAACATPRRACARCECGRVPGTRPWSSPSTACSAGCASTACGRRRPTPTTLQVISAPTRRRRTSGPPRWRTSASRACPACASTTSASCARASRTPTQRRTASSRRQLVSTSAQGGGSVIYAVPIAMDATQQVLPNTSYANPAIAAVVPPPPSMRTEDVRAAPCRPSPCRWWQWWGPTWVRASRAGRAGRSGSTLTTPRRAPDVPRPLSHLPPACARSAALQPGTDFLR